jgi:hypothetical protein
MISPQTLRVRREGKPLHTFPDHALLAETELREGNHADHPMLPKLFENIRALAGPPGIPTVVPAVDRDDPIFAAIEEHKKAAQAHSEQVRYNSSLEKTLPEDKQRSLYIDEIVETDDPQWIRALQAPDGSADEIEDLALNLLNIKPTSVAGAVRRVRQHLVSKVSINVLCERHILCVAQ